ncbi:hypothetical protein ACS3SW_19035 [Roseobacteraceae bacterium S113]
MIGLNMKRGVRLPVFGCAAFGAAVGGGFAPLAFGQFPQDIFGKRKWARLSYR